MRVVSGDSARGLFCVDLLAVIRSIKLRWVLMYLHVHRERPMISASFWMHFNHLPALLRGRWKGYCTWFCPAALTRELVFIRTKSKRKNDGNNLNADCILIDVFSWNTSKFIIMISSISASSSNSRGWWAKLHLRYPGKQIRKYENKTQIINIAGVATGVGKSIASGCLGRSRKETESRQTVKQK